MKTSPWFLLLSSVLLALVLIAQPTFAGTVSTEQTQQQGIPEGIPIDGPGDEQPLCPKKPACSYDVINKKALRINVTKVASIYNYNATTGKRSNPRTLNKKPGDLTNGGTPDFIANDDFKDAYKLALKQLKDQIKGDKGLVIRQACDKSCACKGVQKVEHIINAANVASFTTTHVVKTAKGVTFEVVLNWTYTGEKELWVGKCLKLKAS